MANKLEPVAWRYRYVYPDRPVHWTVRQSPVEPMPPTEGRVGIEVEPLYLLPPEAADEITRLNAENERLTKEADDLGEQANRWRNAWGESQTLVDEMREGLEPFAKAAEPYRGNQDAFEIVLPRGPFFGKDDWPPRFTVGDFRKARGLITKASRDSGHG